MNGKFGEQSPSIQLLVRSKVQNSLKLRRTTINVMFWDKQSAFSTILGFSILNMKEVQWTKTTKFNILAQVQTYFEM